MFSGAKLKQTNETLSSALFILASASMLRLWKKDIYSGGIDRAKVYVEGLESSRKAIQERFRLKSKLEAFSLKSQSQLDLEALGRDLGDAVMTFERAKSRVGGQETAEAFRLGSMIMGTLVQLHCIERYEDTKLRLHAGIALMKIQNFCLLLLEIISEPGLIEDRDFRIRFADEEFLGE